MTHAHPNILLFLTDDHGAWANACYGNSEIESPNLDALAQAGLRFDNAFTPCPVCSPARACLLTGRTPSQVGIHDWLQEQDKPIGDHDWLADEITLPELLSAAGYYCGLSGKWHLGQSHQRPKGFQWHFGLQRWQGVHNGEYTYTLNNQDVTLTGNKSELITDYALDFLKNRPADRPFFLNVGYIATHSPYEAESHAPEKTARYASASFADIPPYQPHNWHKNEGLAGGFQPSVEAIYSRYQGYYTAVTEIDTQVGRLISWLEAQDQLDNTLIIYTSDHGCALGHQGFWGKGNSTRPLNMYEVSLRVPLMIRWGDKLPPNKVIDACIDHYDTFQTLCDWAGVSLPDGRQYPGRSYTALAQGEPADWDDTRYGEYGDLRMIRTPQYKLVKRYPTGPYDLFDLAADPDETFNRAGWDEYREVQERLTAQLERWYTNHQAADKSGLSVKILRQHNQAEAWRDGRRERRGLQVY